jgi:integrase/recombinase XerD
MAGIPGGSMSNVTEQQRRINLKIHDHLESWIEEFLFAKKAENKSPGTLEFYQVKIKTFLEFCDRKVITGLDQLTSGIIREYLVELETHGHNPGGIHACYRTVKAFLNWYEAEAEPPGWRNPITRVKAPAVNLDPLQPAELKVIKAMIEICAAGTLLGDRDRAIMTILLDSGARASEFLALNVSDCNQVTGSILIRMGKGRKSRTVFLGRTVNIHT